MKFHIKSILLFCWVLIPSGLLCYGQTVDYSVVYVNEESGINFTRVSNDNDYVCLPIVKRSRNGVDWLTNRILDISKDGQNIAYLSARNNTTNIFIKDLSRQGSSVQRTNRQSVLDFSYSPDGKYIVFSEGSGTFNQIYQTSATQGYVCRQITNSNKDYTPTYTPDMQQILFARQELRGSSIWSYNIANNFLSTYTTGYNPCANASNTILCARTNSEGRSEIWMVNINTGSEECIISAPDRSFTTPSISPDGKWILCVGSSGINGGNFIYYNTDIFVCKKDGTNLTQLTYHAADDLSPVWSRDGKYIYFISQRGSAQGVANIWKMDFVLTSNF